MNILNIDILYCIESKCFKDAKSTIFDIVRKIKYIAPSFIESPVRYGGSVILMSSCVILGTWECNFVNLYAYKNDGLFDWQTVTPYNVNVILCFCQNFSA